MRELGGKAATKVGMVVGEGEAEMIDRELLTWFHGSPTPAPWREGEEKDDNKTAFEREEPQLDGLKPFVLFSPRK